MLREHNSTFSASIKLQEKINSKKKLSSENNIYNKQEYLTSNLIAYIGNKRRLLPLLEKAIDEIRKNGSNAINKGGIFLDYFSGTGVVGRLAATKGFRVVANDWEDYAVVLAKAFLCCNATILKCGFNQHGGFLKLLETLNAGRANAISKKSKKNSEDKKTISTFYSPKNLDANPNLERMFYTPENGLLIDSIRNFIWKNYDEVLQFKINDLKKRQLKKERDLLLGLLIVQASKRSNTSGVFKAYHHGFGGRKQDALKRILHKVQLEKPILIPQNSLYKNKAFKSDAFRLAKKMKRIKAEIVYLDPPYNQHQYGSNYHILNTVARWDNPGIPLEINSSAGRNKGGIRSDWKKTHSKFCSKKTALYEFAKMVELVNAKYLMISYSTEGMIDFEELIAVLAKKGRLAIVTAPYVRYRGGRQSNATAKKNVEFVLIVDASLPCRTKDVSNVRGVLINAKMQSMMDENLPLLPITNYKQTKLFNKNYKHINYLCNSILKQKSSANANSVNAACDLWELHFSLKNSSSEGGFFLLHKPTSKTLQLNSKLQIQKKLTNLKLNEFAALYGDLSNLLMQPNHEKIAGILQALFINDECLDKKFLLAEAFRLAEKINAVKTPREYHAMLQWLQELNKIENAKNYKSSVAYGMVLKQKVRSLELKMEKLLVEKIFTKVFA